MSYCFAIEQMPESRRAIHQAYHDLHYGFPIHDDNELFCRLVLEINQAGLSWETILRKEAAFRLAFDEFNIEAVAQYNDKDKERLLGDAGIIRNRLKINAAIENARTILRLQQEFGSFEKWLEQKGLGLNQPLKKDDWVKLFKKTFLFTGGEIVNEFLTSTGFLPAAHSDECPVQKQVLLAKPFWLTLTY